MNNIDHAIAQGLGDQPFDGGIHYLRAEQEEKILDAKGDLQNKLAEANALKIQVESMPDGLDKSEVNINAVVTSAPAEYSENVKELHQTKKIEEVFRCRHGLTRSAIEPSILNNVLLFGIMVFIEGMVNASFFLTAHISATPIAALLLSLLISLTNIAVSSCVGFFVGRKIDYGANAIDADKFAKQRRIARVLLGCYVLVIALFHATVALVRYQETMDGIEHSFSNYVGMMTTPEPLFLILIGVVMSVVAYKKSLSAFDDPYPGYGERHRAVLDAQEAVYDFHEQLQEKIEARFDEVLANAETTYKTKVKAVNKYNALVNDCIQAHQHFEQTVAQAGSTLKSQITLVAEHYRAAMGEQSKLNLDIPKHLTNFQSFLVESDIPPTIPIPEFQDFKSELNQSKAQALQQLDELFEPSQPEKGALS